MSPEIAFQALEEGSKAALSPMQIVAARAAILSLCGSIERKIADALELQAALPGFPPDEGGPSQDLTAEAMGETPDIWEGWQTARELLGEAARVLRDTFGAPQVCARQTASGDRCGSCPHVPSACPGGVTCLHLVRAEGTGRAREIERVPIRTLPGALRRARSVTIQPRQFDSIRGPLATWVRDAGGHGLFAAVGAGEEPLALLGLASDRPLSDAVSCHAERIRRYLALALFSAQLVQNAQANLQRLQETGIQLAAANLELRRGFQARNAMLAGMSHELRTPLNAVIGLAALMRDGALGPINDEQAAHLTAIEASGKQLLALVEDLLEIATIDSGNLRLAPEPCVVARVFAEALQSLCPFAKRRQVKVHSSLPSDCAVGVLDPQRLRQVVANLVSNAIKHSPPGTSVDVVARVEADQLLFSIKDSGPGIPVEEQELIFQEFRHSPSATEDDEVGSGLGLPLVKRLVEAQGGSIEVRSKQGGGSEFRVSLPMGAAVTSAPVATETAFAATKTSGQRPVAVVAEADAATRVLLVEAVVRAGLEAVELALPEHLPAAVRECRPVVVVVSQALGGYNLHPSLHQLRQDRETADLPVVFVGERRLQDQALAIGVTATAGYPLDIEALSDLIRSVTKPEQPPAPQLALIIDDNPSFLDAMAIILQSVGLETLRARDGVEGLELARRHHPHVIFLDIMMPRCDGGTLLERIRADEALGDIPVVVLTIFPLSPDEQLRLTNQGATVLSKATFDPTEVWDALRRAGIRVCLGGVQR